MQKRNSGENLMTYTYDPQSDVLAVTLKNRPFSYAQEAGDFIVHYDASDVPVYLEILNAHQFLSGAMTALPKNLSEKISRHTT